MFYKGKVRRKYIRALYEEQPVRCAISTNPSPYQQFAWALDGAEEVLNTRNIPYNERQVYQIIEHLINKWPRGLTSYNMWYVMHTAQESGILGKQFTLIKEACFVDEEQAKRQHIVRTGGVGALSIYLEE